MRCEPVESGLLSLDFLVVLDVEFDEDAPMVRGEGGGSLDFLIVRTSV